MKMSRSSLVVVIVAVVALAASAAWWLNRNEPSSDIVLYGNVDVRQVSLAFNASERVAEMRVTEGDVVKQGQVVAVLDTTALKLRIVRAKAQASVQQHGLQRLQTGSRPEEIAQARAGVAVAQAEVHKAQLQHRRLQDIGLHTGGRAVSQQELDASRAALSVAQAQLDSAQKGLDLSLKGPRVEDIAQARAQLEAAQAELALQEQQLTDAELKAPVDAVVRSRLLEPGDMASPQRPAYALAIVSPKWVRAYISETELGHIRPGQPAQVAIDSYPGQPLDGRVGYISSVAEFTPKMVQTEDLRTSLVYEIRINVDDPNGRLRLGMPATVHIMRGQPGGAGAVLDKASTLVSRAAG